MLLENNGFVKPALRRQLEKIKSAVSIAEVASEYGTFRQTTPTRLLGRCFSPSHEDKTPSMVISTDTQTFKCFGCHERGDVLDLIRLLEGCDLLEAMGLLAGRYGISLESTRSQSWFRKQHRQKPARDFIERMKKKRAQRRLYRWLCAPVIAQFEDVGERRAEEAAAWSECGLLAHIVVAGGEAQDAQ